MILKGSSVGEVVGDTGVAAGCTIVGAGAGSEGVALGGGNVSVGGRGVDKMVVSTETSVEENDCDPVQPVTRIKTKSMNMAKKGRLDTFHS